MITISMLNVIERGHVKLWRKSELKNLYLNVPLISLSAEARYNALSVLVVNVNLLNYLIIDSPPYSSIFQQQIVFSRLD